MPRKLSRRDALKASLGASALAVTSPVSAAPAKRPKTSFIYSLNTSTISGQKLPITQVIDITAKAGYNAIEPWIREIDDYVKAGGSLKDLKNRLSDKGLTVESSIGFFEWIVDDADKRKRALEEAKRNFDLVAQIGGKRLAAPPLGATNQTDMNLMRAAERYRALLDLGDQFGVVPQAEIWGFSKTLGKLSEAVLIAVESGHPKACILPDVFHLYKGGSDIQGLRLLGPNAFHNFHLNDYPTTPPRDQINDGQRVYPGDGSAPLGELFKILQEIGYKGALSVELFNNEYYKQDALVSAKTALTKLKSVVQKSLG